MGVSEHMLQCQEMPLIGPHTLLSFRIQEKKKKADKVDIHHRVLCDFENVYTGRERNK